MIKEYTVWRQKKTRGKKSAEQKEVELREVFAEHRTYVRGDKERMELRGRRRAEQPGWKKESNDF